MSEIYQNLGIRMSTRRKSLKMTQTELAERLGASNNHISAIETGNQKPSMDMFIKICNELRTTPDYLLLGSMRGDNVSQNLIETIRLCKDDDIAHLQTLANALSQKNESNFI